mmetsp:Transcript_103576/g.270473  ORF Transcript_103576/g.270473 Transcript_103576/m.270473 type:complete len:225 (-) Transcript_103576:355-1029(-)
MSRSLVGAALALSWLAQTPLAAGSASSGGWYEQRPTCTGLNSLCGDGCTVHMGDCRDGQCYTMMGAPTACAPAVMGCNEMDKKVAEGGCCPFGTLSAGPGSCVEASCESKLQYHCGSDASAAPACAEEPTAPAELGASITGTVTRCAKGSAVCYALDSQPLSGSWEWVYKKKDRLYLARGCDSDPGPDPAPDPAPISGAAGSHGLVALLLPGLLLPAAGLLSAA